MTAMPLSAQKQAPLPALPAIQWPALLFALAGLAWITVAAMNNAPARLSLLPAIGFGAGFALYRASLGFASAWRVWLSEGRSRGVRAQIVMIGLAAVAFFPLLAYGSFGGLPLTGFVNPVGVALCVGAFLFGIGMQLGGGCGSGTLYTAGGGNVRMVITLAAFIAGSVIAAMDFGGWSEWPSAGAYSIVTHLGAGPALFVVLTLLSAAYRLLVMREQARHGKIVPFWADGIDFPLRAHWTLMSAVLALVLVNIATLLVAGRPWGITSAFALWGSKIVALTGADVHLWPYWQGDPSLSASVFADGTSLMNFGLMLGAFSAAALAGALKPQWRIAGKTLAASIIGGLLMGYGARLATGCNIGAFFSGMASGSLHGAVWLLFALPGTMVGIRLRALFAP
ncbi:MAG: YeeE/YedE family protein [Beijerinckiaceae bacterium]